MGAGSLRFDEDKSNLVWLMNKTTGKAYHGIIPLNQVPFPSGIRLSQPFPE
jgi:hypothetical protein